MRVLFAGSPAPAVAVLTALRQSHHEVAAVLTRPPARSGRGRATTPSAVAQASMDAGLEVLAPQRPDDPDFVSRLNELGVDIAVVVAYGALLPEPMLRLIPYGWINLHFSVLPQWRGAAPVQHAILSGDEITGATAFRIEAGLDTGPMFGLVTETIRPSDTAGDLLDRLAGAGADLLVQTLDGIGTGTLVPVPQSGEVSYAPKLTSGDAQIRWTHPALAVDRRIRAVTPRPGAWTTIRGERLGIGPVAAVPTSERVPPGQLVVERREVLVGTATDPVRLGSVTPSGRRPMAATDWSRGARLEEGIVLGETA